MFELPTMEPSEPKPYSPKGRKGTGFYLLLKAFSLAPLLHIEEMVSTVHFQVMANPVFAALCGFDKIPSLKTFERFDQIIAEESLWEETRKKSVWSNDEVGIIKAEDLLAVDISHVEAEATLNATHKICGHSQPCECPDVPTDDNVGLVRKSNTVVTK